LRGSGRFSKTSDLFRFCVLAMVMFPSLSLNLSSGQNIAFAAFTILITPVMRFFCPKGRIYLFHWENRRIQIDVVHNSP
jgi:nitrate reductase NapE component